MEDFYNSYKFKYFVLPLYYLIDVFTQINREYDNYVNKLYDDDDDTNTHEETNFFI